MDNLQKVINSIPVWRRTLYFILFVGLWFLFMSGIFEGDINAQKAFADFFKVVRNHLTNI